MKVVILAGGLGTRLSEETQVKPKPMVEVGGKPILWHIMRTYAAHGFNEFVIALGFKAEIIKDYFLNYCNLASNISVCLATGEVRITERHREDWTVHLLDTGIATQTGGRVKRAAEFIGPEPFMLTYGDGVARIDIRELLKFHKEQGKLATLTAVRPPSRFGTMEFDGDRVTRFDEKPQLGEGWINGGFFVLEPGVSEYIKGDETLFEKEPLERLAREGQLAAYRLHDFWHCMDTLRDVRFLNEIWALREAPWKVWE